MIVPEVISEPAWSGIGLHYLTQPHISRVWRLVEQRGSLPNQRTFKFSNIGGDFRSYVYGTSSGHLALPGRFLKILIACFRLRLDIDN
jgi:hypothetical protein